MRNAAHEASHVLPVSAQSDFLHSACQEARGRLEGINSRINEAEDRISEVEDRMVETNVAERKKKKNN